MDERSIWVKVLGYQIGDYVELDRMENKIEFMKITEIRLDTCGFRKYFGICIHGYLVIESERGIKRIINPWLFVYYRSKCPPPRK